MSKLKLSFPVQFGIFNRMLKSGGELEYPLNRRASIKNIIEAIGVPHTEIGGIVVDNTPVDFEFLPFENHRCHVHPIHPPYDVFQPTLLRPVPLNQAKFIADLNVGKLASFMRMIGLDTSYDTEFADGDIANQAEAEDRIVISKDTGLLKRRKIVYGRYVRSIHPTDQLQEIIEFFGLSRPFRAFSRCLRCNTELVEVDKKTVCHRLEPKTRKYFNRFKLCTVCDKIYWRGSHHEHMEKRLQRLTIPWS